MQPEAMIVTQMWSHPVGGSYLSLVIENSVGQEYTYLLWVVNSSLVQFAYDGVARLS